MSLSLEQALAELEDELSDFETVGYQNAGDVLERIVESFDRAPLRSLAESMLPPVDFGSWWQRASSTTGSMVGSGKLSWPKDKAERASVQLRLLRAIAGGEIDLTDFAIHFCYASTRYDDNLLEFSQRVLRPFLRDFANLAELRISPPVLAEAIVAAFPPTGDAVLDDLLQRARDGFRDLSPTTRRVALEKLWDAWERLKSLHEPTDKKRSTAELLDRAAPDEAFRRVLETEASALTAIGNLFHIRHFEANRTPVIDDAQVDYLFHRMWSLLWFVIARNAGRSNPPTLAA